MRRLFAGFVGVGLFGGIGGVLFYWLFLDIVGNKKSTMSELVKDPRTIIGCICFALAVICSFSSRHPAPSPSPVPSSAPSPQITELPVIDYVEILRNSEEYDGQEVRVAGRIAQLGWSSYTKHSFYFSDRLGFLDRGEYFEVRLSRHFSYNESVSDYYELDQYVLVQGTWHSGGYYPSLRDAQVIDTGEEEARQADQAFMDEWLREKQADAELPMTDYMDLIASRWDYKDQRVRTVGRIYDTRGDSIWFQDRETGEKCLECSLRGCPPEMLDSCKDGEYVLLSGLFVCELNSDPRLKDVFVESTGSEVQALSEQADADWWVRFAAEREDYISDCQPCVYDDLARYPDTYRGKQAALSGTVLRVDEGLSTDTVYLDLGQNCVVCIKYSGKLLNDPKILKGDQITFYGECAGEGLYESQIGESEYVPQLNARYSSFNQPCAQ